MSIRIAACVAALAGLASCHTAPSFSDVLLETEVGYVSYEEGMEDEQYERYRLGWTADHGISYYAWYGSESAFPRVIGQGIGGVDQTAFGVGIGYNLNVVPVRFFLEYGEVGIDFKPSENARNEVVKTQLWQNHQYENRYGPGWEYWQTREFGIPLPKQFDEAAIQANDWSWDNNYEYHIEDTWQVRIGAQWEIFPHAFVSAAYRWQVSDTYMAMWDSGPGIPERHKPGEDDCGCWWEEKGRINFSAFEIGVGLTW